MKICCRCKIEKEYSEFYRHRKYNDGYRPECKICTKHYEHICSSLGTRYYQKNKELIQVKNREYYRKNSVKLKAVQREWQKQNSELTCFYSGQRRALQKKATPKWLTKEQLEEIKQVYLNCPKGHHVDHIYPLVGKESCGLHVPWNLQYLSAHENIVKGNRI